MIRIVISLLVLILLSLYNAFLCIFCRFRFSVYFICYEYWDIFLPSVTFNLLVVFSLVLSDSFILDKFLCLLILLICLNFSLNLDGTVIHPSLACVSLCGSIPMQSVCAQLFWSESWIWCEDRSPLAPGCTGIYYLVGRSKSGDRGARGRARCELGLLFSVAVTTLAEAGSRSGSGLKVPE